MGSRVAALLALVVCVLASGCHRLDRAEECRALSGLVNPVLVNVDAQRKAEPESAIVHRAIAMQYEALSAKLLAWKPSAQRLADAAAEYQKLVADASRNAKTFAEALEAKNPAKIAEARSHASRDTKREAAIIGKIDSFCRPPK